MVPVKIACECGQKFAFDVEPVNGRMPTTVACPSCGADGTAAANDYISQSGSATGRLAANPPPPPAPVPVPAQAPMRLARAQAQPSSAGSPAIAPDDAGRAKLVQEARVKMIGGDSTEQVAAFLTVKGFDRAEAMELARGFYKERAKVVRGNGVKKMAVGVLMMVVPLCFYIGFREARRISIRASLWAYGVGIAGAYLFVSGIIMILAPKSEKGTVVKE